MVEEASRAGFTAIAGNLSVHSDIVAPYILHLGSDEQKQRYLSKMAAGECIGAIAMTEPGAGSDLQGARTRAEADGDGYRINGQKTFISGVEHADTILVVARNRMPDGSMGLPLLFLVPADAAGLTRQPVPTNVGWAEWQWTLYFDDVEVDDARLVGGDTGGLGALFDGLNPERIMGAAGGVGSARLALDKAKEYAKVDCY